MLVGHASLLHSGTVRSFPDSHSHVTAMAAAPQECVARTDGLAHSAAAAQWPSCKSPSPSLHSTAHITHERHGGRGHHGGPGERDTMGGWRGGPGGALWVVRAGGGREGGIQFKPVFCDPSI